MNGSHYKSGFSKMDSKDSLRYRRRQSVEEIIGVCSLGHETTSDFDSGGDAKIPEVPHFRSRNPPKPSLFQYFCSEVTRSYWLENDEARYSERREKVYTFVKVPRDVEKFILYGSLQCLDAFLFVFTFLPLRFLLALWFLVSRPCVRLFRRTGRRTGGLRILTPSEICDILKAITLIVSCFIMTYIDTSMMYHMIKSQSVIKLYIFFNMLEVSDRLLSAFGQDVLDTLFWTATDTKERKREHFGVIPHLFFAIVYVVLHTILVLLQATTLNVAINSSNKALLTIMMSNNFIELKGSVFKRFGKNNLFQMSCSDVRERFTYFILLLTVIIQTMKEYSWKGDRFWILLPDCLCVLISEVVVDCVKHAFITRFNEIPTEVYHEYTVSLAYDLACSKHKNAFSDHSDLVARRMGFIPLPLSVLLFRITSQAISIPNFFGVVLLFMVYVCLIMLKVLNSIVILGQACKLIDNHQKARQSQQQQQQQKPTSSTSPPPTPPPQQQQQQQQQQRSSSHPPSRKQSTERPAPMPTSKSVSHSRNPSYTDGMAADSVAALIKNQQPLGPQPIFCNSTVSLNSLGINEALLDGRLSIDSLQDIARKLSRTEWPFQSSQSSPSPPPPPPQPPQLSPQPTDEEDVSTKSTK